MQLEQDLFTGHAITSARDLREIFRKIFTGEREHSRFLTAFAEALHFADSENFYALAPSALLLIDRYPLLVSYADQVLDVDDPATQLEADGFNGLRHRTAPSHLRRQSLRLVQVRQVAGHHLRQHQRAR